MNKRCFKKLFYIILMTMFLALSLTACGEKNKTDESRKQRKEKLDKDESEVSDETDEATDTDCDEVESDISDLNVSEPDTAEPESDEEQDNKKWKYKYKNFFDEYGPVIRDNMKAYGEAVLNGVELTMDYSYTDDAKCMVITNGGKSCELYGVSNELYFQYGLGYEWVMMYSVVDFDESFDIGQLFLPEKMLKQTNYITYSRYLKEVEEDGIIYDVIKGLATDKDSQYSYYVECYVDREKQEISKMDVLFDEANGTDALHWEFQYPEEDMIYETIRYICSTISKSGEQVSLNKLRNTYADFMDAVTGGGKTNTSGSGKDKDWADYYESYYETQYTIPDSYGFKFTIDAYGTDIIFDSVVTEEEVYVRCNVLNAIVDAYLSEERILVGAASKWAYTYPDNMDYVEDILQMDTWKKFGEPLSELTYVAYCGTEEINKKVYDVIEVKLADSTSAKAYINRKNQKVYKVKVTASSTQVGDMEWLFEDYGKIKIPKEAKKAKEMSVDDLNEFYVKILEDGMKN